MDEKGTDESVAAFDRMTDDEIKQLYTQTGTAAGLAKLLNVSTGRVRGRLSRAGVITATGSPGAYRHNDRTAAVIARIKGVPVSEVTAAPWDEALARAILASANGNFSTMGALLGITRQAAKGRYDRALRRMVA